VAELVQRPATTGGLEYGFGLLVAQPGVAVLVEVGSGKLDAGSSLGHEHRTRCAIAEQARQEPRGPGLAHDDIDGAAFAADPRAAVRPVEALDVEGRDLVRPGGGLVEHRPERALAERHVLAS
jgi:hypothetical protein